MTEKRFNLIDEKWIPVADKGLVSLRDIFSDVSIPALGGDPVQKISVMKLLLAIAQSAWTPANDTEWRSVGVAGMCDRVVAYLGKWHDAFWLYGDKPFLQMPEIEKAEKKSFGCVLPMVAYGNATILTDIQVEHDLTEAEKAMTLIQQMSFALSGKKTDNTVVLSAGYPGKMNEKGRPSSGKAGPGVAFQGLLHSFVFGKTLVETVWFNLFSADLIATLEMYPCGLGIAPWEKMPTGEDDLIARSLRDSYIGRLIPMSRFMLLKDDGIHYSEGISHKNYLEGIVDPSIAVNFSAKKTSVIWVDTEKRPWRQLTALLSFMSQNEGNFRCIQLISAIKHLQNVDSFIIWSGGMRVSSNAGEQYLSGTDDFVESEVQLSGAIFNNASKFITTLNNEMEIMDSVSRSLWGRVSGYFKGLKVEGKVIASSATGMYWQLCERIFQKLVNACVSDPSGAKAKEYRKKYLENAYATYDRFCPNQTARQMESWAANRFGFEKNVTNEKKEAVK
jgi:CRISPR system Cascade subunit CasA